MYFPAVAPPLAIASSGAIVASTPINPNAEAVDAKNPLRDDDSSLHCTSSIMLRGVVEILLLVLLCGTVKAWLNAMTDINVIAFMILFFLIDVTFATINSVDIVFGSSSSGDDPQYSIHVLCVSTVEVMLQTSKQQARHQVLPPPKQT